MGDLEDVAPKHLEGHEVADLDLMGNGKSRPDLMRHTVPSMSLSLTIQEQPLFVLRMIVLGTVPTYRRKTVGIVSISNARDNTTLAKWVGPMSSWKFPTWQASP
jgi:hypothetical protein